MATLSSKGSTEIRRVTASLVQPAAPRMASDAPQSTVTPWHRGTGLSPSVSPLCSGLHAEGGEQGPHFWGLTLQKGRAERAVGVTERGSPLLREGIFPCSGSTAWAARWMQPGNVQDGLQHPANSSALPGPADTQHKALIRPGLCMLIPIMSGPPPLYQAPEWAHCLRAEHSSYQAPANGSPGATQ